MPEREPDQAPVDEMYESEPLGDDGERVDQENVAGKDNLRGGGEFPDPHTPPSESAAGDLRPSPEPGRGQFQEAYDAAPNEVADSGAIRHDAEPDDEND